MIPTRRALSSLASRTFRTSLPRGVARVAPTALACAVPRSAVASSLLRHSGSCFRSFHATSLQLDDETVKVPSMAESITEGMLKQWLKKEGDYVQVDEEVATIETDKIDVAVNAPKSGYIRELLAQEEDTVTVGQDLFKLEAGEAPEGGVKTEEAPKKEAPKKEAPKKEAPKKEAPKEEAPQEEKKPEPTQEAKQTEKNETPAPPPKPTKSSPKQESDKKPEPMKEEKAAPEPRKASAPGSREETRVKMSRMRLRIAERLKQSQNAAASLTTFNEIDMSSLMAMRSAYKDSVLKNTGVKLGFMSAFAKAACLALKEIPAANASIEDDQIIYRDYVDLSVAVATPKGLVTPVLRNAESLDFLGIEQGIADLGKKARDNKLTLEDMAGGSFTISNGGVFGSMYGTPIINLPQAAVLGMHAVKDRAVVVDGQIVIRPIMIVALTYDHRLLDGREAVTFLVRIKEYIEDPRRMLLA